MRAGPRVPRPVRGVRADTGSQRPHLSRPAPGHERQEEERGRRGEGGGRRAAPSPRQQTEGLPSLLSVTGLPVLGEQLPGTPSLSGRWNSPSPWSRHSCPFLGCRGCVSKLTDDRSRREYHLHEFPKFKMEHRASGKAGWIIKALIQTLVCLRAPGSGEHHCSPPINTGSWRRWPGQGVGSAQAPSSQPPPATLREALRDRNVRGWRVFTERSLPRVTAGCGLERQRHAHAARGREGK